MKNLATATVFVLALALGASLTSADELGSQSAPNGNLSSSQMAELGLGGMTAMSDRQGEQVRGNGFTLTYGRSYARGARPDGYFRPRPYFSAGSSSAFGQGAWAGGGSIAIAF